MINRNETQKASKTNLLLQAYRGIKGLRAFSRAKGKYTPYTFR